MPPRAPVALASRDRVVYEKYAPDQPRDDRGRWTEGGGGTLFHGTSAPGFRRFRPGVAYLAPSGAEAGIYATSPVLSKPGGEPRVLEVRAAPGRSKDVNARVEDAVMGDEDVDEVVGTLAATARSEGFRYISFEHPGGGEDYITVRVSLYPDEDLRILRTHRAVEKYDESEHPRDESGRWISGGGGGSRADVAAAMKAGLPHVDELGPAASYVLPDGTILGRTMDNPTHSALAARFIPDEAGWGPEEKWNPEGENRVVGEIMRRSGAVRVVYSNEIAVGVSGPLSPAQARLFIGEARAAGMPLIVDVYRKDGGTDGEIFARPTVDEVNAWIARQVGVSKAYDESEHPRDEDGKWVVDPAGIGASLDEAGRSTASHEARVSAALDALPAGYEIKAGKRTYTHTLVGSDKFWIDDRGKGYAARDVYLEVGSRRLIPHIGAEALGQGEVSKAVTHDGVMVALRLPPAAAGRLALGTSGAEAAEDLHVTLVYLGDSDELDPNALGRLHDGLSALAARTPPVSGRVTGYGRFTNDEEDVLWAGLDAPDLAELRHEVLQEARGAGLEPAGDHGWTPHVTLAYVEPGAGEDAAPPDVPVTFRYLSVVSGGREVALRLAGAEDEGGAQRALPPETFSELQRSDSGTFYSVEALEEWARGRGDVLVRADVLGPAAVVVKKGAGVSVGVEGMEEGDEAHLEDLVAAMGRIAHDYVMSGRIVARSLSGRWLRPDELGGVLSGRALASPVFFPDDLLVMDGDLTDRPAVERWELLRALVPEAGGSAVVPKQVLCGADQDLEAAVESCLAWRPSEGVGLVVSGATCVAARSAYSHGLTGDVARLEREPAVKGNAETGFILPDGRIRRVNPNTEGDHQTAAQRMGYEGPDEVHSALAAGLVRYSSSPESDWSRRPVVALHFMEGNEIGRASAERYVEGHQGVSAYFVDTEDPKTGHIVSSGRFTPAKALEHVRRPSRTGIVVDRPTPWTTPPRGPGAQPRVPAGSPEGGQWAEKYEEGEHPRDESGRWTESGGGASVSRHAAAAKTATEYLDSVDAGEVKMVDAHNAAWITPDGRLYGKFVDHYESAEHILGLLGESKTDSWLTERMLAATGFIRFGMTGDEVDVEVVGAPTAAQVSALQDVIRKHRPERFVYDISREATGRGAVTGEGWGHFLEDVGVRKDYDEAEHPRDESGRWTGAGGGGRMSSPVRKVMEAAERKYESASAEYAFIADKDGNVLLRDKTSGAPNYVRFTEGEVSRIRSSPGAVFTHNHPAGRSLSLDDVRLARNMLLSEIRASTSTSVFSMRPGPAGWPPYTRGLPDPANPSIRGYDVDTLIGWYTDFDKQVFDDFTARIKAATMTVDEASAKHHDEVWRRLVAAHPEHLVYSEEDRY
jgi:2'-5' RNA ligase